MPSPVAPHDRRDVGEKVAIAVLTTLGNCLINWGIQEAKDWLKQRRDKRKEAEEKQKAEQAQAQAASETPDTPHKDG